jgi:hypothetical protein
MDITVVFVDFSLDHCAIFVQSGESSEHKVAFHSADASADATLIKTKRSINEC